MYYLQDPVHPSKQRGVGSKTADGCRGVHQQVAIMTLRRFALASMFPTYSLVPTIRQVRVILCRFILLKM
jgi:hypothetical protein